MVKWRYLRMLAAHLDEGGYFVVEVAVHNKTELRREISGRSSLWTTTMLELTLFDDPSYN